MSRIITQKAEENKQISERIYCHDKDMIKKTPKVFYEYKGKMMSVCDIYKSNKKRRGRSRYLLSVDVNVVKKR